MVTDALLEETRNALQSRRRRNKMSTNEVGVRLRTLNYSTQSLECTQYLSLNSTFMTSARYNRDP